MSTLLNEVYEAKSLLCDRENQELADYTLSAVLSRVAEYLQREKFVSVKKRLPEFTHKNWTYTSETVIGSILTDSGIRYTAPVRYEKTLLRGKPVERWADIHGGIFRDRKVTHWRPFPVLDENDEQEAESE